MECFKDKATVGFADGYEMLLSLNEIQNMPVKESR